MRNVAFQQWLRLVCVIIVFLAVPVLLDYAKKNIARSKTKNHNGHLYDKGNFFVYTSLNGPEQSLNGPEKCFGAVGSQCDGTVLSKREDLPNGLVKMKVSVGSIAHDTCCARNPNGKWCGRYQECGHDGRCDKEWNKAFWNTIDNRMWDHVFDPNINADTSLINNSRSATFATNYLGGGVIRLLETPSTIILSAPKGTALDVGDEQFCASGNASGPVAVGGKQWIVCQ